MAKKIKIGLITATDPNDKQSWSGVHYRMLKALENQGFSVVILGPVVLDKFTNYFLKIALYYLNTLHTVRYGKKYNKVHSQLVSFFHGRFFRKKIKEHTVDVIFAPAASNQIANLRTETPICYYSDATFALMLNYYDNFSGFSKISIKESNQIEQKAINKSKTQVFSSKWAFNSAAKNYMAKKAFVVKMGANIESDPPQEVLFKNYDTTLELLFIGVDWKRKGGDIVYETLEKLDNRGYDICLTVVGTVPPKAHPKMKVIPKLNKNIENDRLIFEKVLSNSHLFFLPTRAECFGIVFCEANAYGIPVISTDTGGVSSVIENDVNGYLLPHAATSEDYFKVIESLILDKNKLKQLAKTSREKYNEELNWNNWGIKMKEILLLTQASSNEIKVLN